MEKKLKATQKSRLKILTALRIKRLSHESRMVATATHVAAAISARVHAGPADQLKKLREKMSGFPGVWALCARAALSLQVALIEAGDPQRIGFIECVDDFAKILLRENADWNDDVLKEKARFVVESNKHK